MSSYRQKLNAQAHTTSLLAIEEEKTNREANRRMSLSASECYYEGRNRGLEDFKDNYTGALDRILTLGNDYAWPESYRNGYTSAWE